MTHIFILKKAICKSFVIRHVTKHRDYEKVGVSSHTVALLYLFFL